MQQVTETISILHLGSYMLSFQGGAVDSYTDPATGQPYDFGVMVFRDYGNASGFFDRFNIPVSAKETPHLNYLYADFKTGQLLYNYTDPSGAEEVAALEAYLAVAEKYEDSEYSHVFCSPSVSLEFYHMVSFAGSCCTSLSSNLKTHFVMDSNSRWY